MTKFERGKTSYELAMIACQTPYMSFEELTKKDQNYWSQKEKPMNKLPAPLALKKYIIEYANEKSYSDYKYEGELNTEEEINAAMSHMRSKIGYDAQQDIMEGEWKTPNIPYELFRHCDSESVAVKDNYGNYIGFLRTFSGGKHFDPEDDYEYIVEHAYYLTCQEKEVLTIERTWTKV